MTVTALFLFAAYVGIGFGLRTWVQWRRTGDTGFRGMSGRAGSPEWWAGVLFVLALVAGMLGPVAALAGLSAVDLFSATPWRITGLVLASAGVAATFLTQLDMGDNWRIGVDASERTDLVTTGAFALVRNPIFTAMALTGIGLALMVPNVVALTGAALLLVALQLQVRVVEEPYLHKAHGSTYAGYAAATGRFLPGIGRLEIAESRKEEVT